MSTKIEWTDETWNPVTGCTKISEGCRNCYAERMSKRLAGRFGYPEDEPFRVTLHPDRLDQPLRWRKPRRVFVCSMGDLFHEDVPFDYVGAVFGVMAARKEHTFKILTKRPGRMTQWFEWLDKNADCSTGVARLWQYAIRYGIDDELWGGPTKLPLPNVWLGVTAENQKAADERIPILLRTPAAVRFVSVEPMLGPINFNYGSGTCHCGDQLEDHRLASHQFVETAEPYLHHLDWIICGSETGPNARPTNPDWARSLRDQCHAASVLFFYKKGSDGSRLLDGIEHNAVPPVRS